MRRLRWLQAVLLIGLLAGMVLPQQAHADERVSVLVEQLKQGWVSEPALQGKGMQSADSLFLLGWLYDQGGYGVVKSPERAQELLQQAAELGQFDAMRYCWYDCLSLTPAVMDQMLQGVALEQPQALYLQALYLQERQPEQSRLLLERAARQQHGDAAGKLFVARFVEWAGQRRSLGEAESKLQGCVDDGLSVCYYLLGALYQKHDDPEWALFYYQVLSMVDPELYRSYHLQSQVAGLLSQRPQSDLGVVRARAASYLSQRGKTGNAQIDRFQRCRLHGALDCAERIARAGQRCSLEYFEASYLSGLHDSQGYRECFGRP